LNLLQKNGRFQATVSTVQANFGFTLPPNFSHAIRTITYSAYSYVIPKKPACTGLLKAYIGARFMTPGKNPMMITIICLNTQHRSKQARRSQLFAWQVYAESNGQHQRSASFNAVISRPSSMHQWSTNSIPLDGEKTR
jgi:hypothetical protein